MDKSPQQKPGRAMIFICVLTWGSIQELTYTKDLHRVCFETIQLSIQYKNIRESLDKKIEKASQNTVRRPLSTKAKRLLRVSSCWT